MDAHDRTARNSQTPLQLAKFASKSCKLSFKPVLIQQKSASRKHFPVAGPAARPSKKKKKSGQGSSQTLDPGLPIHHCPRTTTPGELSSMRAGSHAS
jgi:hypothetical protein